MIKKIYTNKAPEPAGPYSQATIVNGFIFCSGQIGLDPKTGKLVEGLENQTRQVLNNLKEVLTAAGSDLSMVVKTTIFLSDIADFQQVNALYGEYFSEYKPARATIEASKLALGALVEIEAVAVIKN